MMQTNQIKLVLGSVGDVGMMGALTPPAAAWARVTVSLAKVANGHKKRQGG